MSLFKKILIPKSKKTNILIICLFVLITLFFILGIFNIQIDNNIITLLPLNKDTKAEINKLKTFNDQYPNDQVIFIAVNADPLTLDKLAVMKNFVNDLEKLKSVKYTLSCFSAIYFKELGGTFTVKRMVERNYDKSEEYLKELYNRLDIHKYLKGTVVSYDKKSLGIIVTMNEKAQIEPKPTKNIFMKFLKVIFKSKYDKKIINRELFAQAVVNVIKNYSDKLEIHYTGIPIYENSSKNSMMRDIVVLLLPSILIIIILLYLNFKTKTGIFFPFLIIAMSVIWTLGLIGWFNIKITVIGAMLPTLIMIIGSSYTLHFLNSYYMNIGLYDDHHDHIYHSSKKIFKTIFFAAITTIAGFISFIFANIDALKSFGIFITLSILITLILTFLLLSKILALRKLPKQKTLTHLENDFFSGALKYFNKLVIPIRWIWVIVFFAAILIFILFIHNLKVETNFVNFFKKNDPVKKDILYIQEKFKGTTVLNITLKTDIDGFFKTREGLIAAQKIQRYIDNNIKMKDSNALGWNFSIVTLLEDLNQTLNGAYDIPEDEALIKKFLSLLKISKKDSIMSNLFTNDFKSINFSVRLFYNNKDLYYFMSEKQILEIQEILKKDMANFAKNDGRYTTDVWGEMFLICKISKFLTNDQKVSLIITFFLVLLIVIFMFRSLVIALLTVIPFTFGVSINFAIMSIFGIPLDTATVMIASISVGIGIDNSIHYTIHFLQNLKKYTSLKKVITETAKFTFRPILFTSLILACGFLVFLFSNFRPLKFFGILLAIAMLTSTFATIFILPAFFYIKEEIARKIKFKKRNKISI